MIATRAPSTLLALAMTGALAIAGAPAVAAPASNLASPPESDDAPGAVLGRIGRCFVTWLYDFGIGGFVIQYGACSVYIPVTDPEAAEAP